MMKLDEDGNYKPWVQPKYGFDADDKSVIAPEDYILVKEGDVIQDRDIPFDVYFGWIKPYRELKKPKPHYHSINRHHARSSGRWTCWARRNY